MANWYKVITSGSNAQLNSLTMSVALTPANGGLGLNAASASGVPIGSGTNSYTLEGSNGTGQVVRTLYARGVFMSGSFSGSFYGDGSNLTGISSAPTFKLSGSTDGTDFDASTNTLAFTSASAHGFDLSMSFASTRKTISLITPQALRTTDNVTFNKLIATTTVTASNAQLTSIPAGLDNTVVVVDGSGNLLTDEIDARVWGATLVDNAGANSAATRVAVFSDADSLGGDANFTFGSNILTVNGSTFGQDTTIAGNLTVLGTTIQLQIANLNIEDRFIYLNSGSSTGDGGLVVSSGSAGNGVAFGWDDSAARWGIQQQTLLTLSSSALAPEAYMAAVVDVDGGQTVMNYHLRNGNIRIESGEIYIYA